MQEQPAGKNIICLFILFMFCWGGGLRGKPSGNRLPTQPSTTALGPKNSFKYSVQGASRSRHSPHPAPSQCPGDRPPGSSAPQRSDATSSSRARKSLCGDGRRGWRKSSLHRGNHRFHHGFVGILQGNHQKAGVLGWCRISAIHSMGMIMFKVLNRDGIWWEDF